MEHKAGFVNIIGNPNVGKSTLMNALVGEKLSIITSKAQTTRHRILGIVNGNDFQVVFSDTPGILKPNYKLQKSMVKFINSALIDADILIYITDIYETFNKNPEYIEKIKTINVPVLLLINKIDLVKQEELNILEKKWKELLPKAEIIPVSALKMINILPLFEKILNLLPESPPYYPKDEITDKPEKFFVAEMIREKIFMNYKKEVPYSAEVEIEEFKENENLIKVKGIIHVTRDSQKGIIIGHKGKALKKTGTEARIAIEKFVGKKVFLELIVKVNKDWRDNNKQLKKFGYN